MNLLIIIIKPIIPDITNPITPIIETPRIKGGIFALNINALEIIKEARTIE